MTFSNPWFILALLGVVGLYHLEFLAQLLNLSSLSLSVPSELEGTVTADEHERTLEYARTSAKFDVVQSTASLSVLLGFWLGGGFGWLDQVIRGLGWGPVASGLAIMGALILLKQMLHLPFELYDTFVIEQRFGFNKTDLKTFIVDRVKGVFLMLLLGVPFMALLLWLFQKFDLAALYGWIAVSAFSVLLTWLAPRLVLPMFYKFTPLQDASLRQAILLLSQKLGFPVADVSVVDGSRRSTKANAFFTGFGKTKRIALFDTLLAHHSEQEILAVLAHEVGHFKRKHVPRQIAVSLAVSGVMFALLHIGLRDPRLCAAFGVMPSSVAWGMIFFAIIYQPLSMVFGWISSHLSRKYEFEADAYARDAMDGPDAMAGALVKLSRDHLSNPTPHPFYVFLHYSHPPVLERLAALRG